MFDSPGEQRKLTAIMFTDMVGYSALAQKNEALALELLEEHRTLLRSIFPGHGGREIEVVGDGFLLEFSSAVLATRCAVVVQKAIAARNATNSTERVFRIRIGIHVGDVVLRNGQMMGDGVNIAARIEPLAEVGGICVSETVFTQVRNKLDEVKMVPLGQPELKNITMPLEVYRVLLPWQQERAVLVTPPTPRTRLLRGGIAATVAILGLVAIVFLWPRLASRVSSTERKKIEGRQLPGLDRTRVAIVPLTAIGSATNDEFTAGLTDELRDRLWKVAGLHPIDATSFMKHRGRDMDFPQIGRELKVGSVLGGTVQMEGETLRMRFQLVDAETREILWSELLDGELKRVFALYGEVAQNVASKLKVRMLTSEKQQVEKEVTHNPESYALYLKGRAFAYKWTKEGVRTGIELLQRSIELDPDFAEARAALAEARITSGYLYVPAQEAFRKGAQEAERALADDTSLAEAHYAMALTRFHRWDFAAAKRELDEALRLRDRFAMAHDWLGWYWVAMGDVDKGIAAMKRALDLDPVSIVINPDLALFYMYARRYDQSVQQCHDSLKMDPGNFQAWLNLGFALASKKDFTHAMEAFETARRFDPDALSVGEALGWTQAISGHRLKALETARDLEPLARRVGRPDKLATIYANLGEPGDQKRAFEELQRGYEIQSPGLLWLKADPIWDPVRAHPEFRQLLIKIGLEK